MRAGEDAEGRVPALLTPNPYHPPRQSSPGDQLTREEQEKEIRNFLHEKLCIDNPDKFHYYVEALTHSIDS